MIALAFFEDGFFNQRRGRTRLDTRAARDALGIEERLPAGGNLGLKPAALDRQRKGALHFLACAHTAGTQNALGRLGKKKSIGFEVSFFAGSLK